MRAIYRGASSRVIGRLSHASKIHSEPAVIPERPKKQQPSAEPLKA
jgi:hypothetical protein